MPDGPNEYYKELRDTFDRNAQYSRQAESYATQLSSRDETKFTQWVKDNNVPFNPKDEIADYDMRGFWKALNAGDKRATSAVSQYDQQIHYPDVWKTPYHKTFSNESIYAMPNAPKWDGSKLIDRNGKVIVDEASPAMEYDTRPIPAHPSGRYPTLNELGNMHRVKPSKPVPYVPISSGGFVRG